MLIFREREREIPELSSGTSTRYFNNSAASRIQRENSVITKFRNNEITNSFIHPRRKREPAEEGGKVKEVAPF